MIIVKGKNVNMWVMKDGDLVPAICSTNLSRRQSVSTLTSLVRGAGSFRRFKPTIKEESITLEGLRTIDTPSSFQIHDFEIGSYYVVRITYDDLSGNTVQLDGEILVTNIDDNNGAADFSTWSVSMFKNGEWSISTTGAADTVPPVVTRARAINSNTVRVTFNKSVVATATGWTVDNGSTLTVTSVSGSGTVWDFTTSGAMSPGQTLLLNYDLFIGNTLSLSGVEHDNLVDFPIENVIVSAGTFIGYFGTSNNILFPAIPLPDLTPQLSGTFTSGGAMAFNLSSLTTDNRYMYFKEPVSEPVKTNWYNTAFNNGTFPDSVFNAPQEVDGFRYYTSRNRMSMDNTQPITAS